MIICWCGDLWEWKLLYRQVYPISGVDPKGFLRAEGHPYAGGPYAGDPIVDIRSGYMYDGCGLFWEMLSSSSSRSDGINHLPGKCSDFTLTEFPVWFRALYRYQTVLIDI